MISYEEARGLVETEINRPEPYYPHLRLVILENLTIERDWGWVFFYNTEAYSESGDFLDSLVGNAPYMVNKLTGELIETGTAEGIEHYIKEYEEKLRSHRK